MKKEFFGTLRNGYAVHKYTLKNEKLEVVLMDRGATIVSLKFDGLDVVGGFDEISDYEADTSHQGAVIGRIANRVENASFFMDGKEYKLPANDGGNCLHGGCGFDFRIWDVCDYSDEKITFQYLSPDGEEGFPSQLTTRVSYIISGGSLIIDYEATPDGKTPVSLTNHAYFNLDGFGGDVKRHKAIIYAERYTEVNESLIPNGNHPKVLGTPFDFKSAHEIGERINEDFDGYDHNYVLSPKFFNSFLGKKLGLAAEVFTENLKMKVYTDQPGIQFYTANFLGDGPNFKGGVKQIKHGAFCLEAQTEPNSVNRGVGFYGKGEKYVQTTVYSFERQGNTQ
ncbi:MAG: galactose mutarotase [Clostridia bacterium]|nr:galactose mutarotase [Clostridia bacterium]